MRVEVGRSGAGCEDRVCNPNVGVANEAIVVLGLEHVNTAVHGVNCGHNERNAHLAQRDIREDPIENLLELGIRVSALEEPGRV